MTKEQKDLIREAYHASATCDLWVEKISKVFPEVIKKKRLKVNTWYSYKENFMIFYKRSQGNYGLNMDNMWMKNALGIANSWNFKKMTATEIKNRLMIEAKRRGLVEGARLKTSWCAHAFTMDGNYEFNEKDNILWCWSSDKTGSYTIFKDGEWASNPGITIEEAEKKFGIKIIN